MKTTLTIHAGGNRLMGFAVNEVTISGDTLMATIKQEQPAVAKSVPMITERKKRRASPRKVSTTMRKQIKQQMRTFGAKRTVGRFKKVKALADKLGLHYTTLYTIEGR